MILIQTKLAVNQVIFNGFSQSESELYNYSMDENNVKIEEDIYASDDCYWKF